MPINLEEFSELKRKAESLKSQADRAQGALEQHMKQLREEFECNSVEEAEDMLEELEVEQKKVEYSYNKALETFKEIWGERLE